MPSNRVSQNQRDVPPNRKAPTTDDMLKLLKEARGSV